jgi:hypothetical protein
MNNLFLQLPFSFNTEPLLADLHLCESESWVEHFNKNDYQGDWTIISLRSPGGSMDTIHTHGNEQYVDTPLLQSCPYFSEITQAFHCEKQAIRLMKLFPGSEIKAHRDQKCGYEDGVFRIHIPLITEPEVLFYFDGHPLHMRVGECWYGNFNALHRIVHEGTMPRVHLVMDCLRNAWSDQLFAEAGYDFAWDEQQKRLKRKQQIPATIEALERMDTDTARHMIAELKKELEHGA